jgi:hypothetical protein
MTVYVFAIIKAMNDDGSRSRNGDSKSIVNNLKNEWSLFWNSLSSDFIESEDEDPFQTGKIQVLSLDQIRDITKALSKNRRLVNQRIESLNKEIELNSVKLESLRLMGGEDDETVRRIHELSDQGQALSQELSKIDERLKLVRQTEEQVKKRNQPA